jgi:hypothetical protein
MWTVTNYTPYAAGKTWARDKDGLPHWIVAVKGTFDIAIDGAVHLAEEQGEPLLLPEYTGEPGVSSLRYDADLSAPKPATDVVLNATAYAPGGRPSTDFAVAVRVASIHKMLRVKGERHWRSGALGLRRTAPQPVTTVPISYERAYGGYDQRDPDPSRHRIDLRNPVGCGMTGELGPLEGDRLPSLEHPSGAIETSGPAGFGPIDSHWSPRREFAGTYDAAWEQNRRPLLAEDWDPRSLLCAPADQQVQGFLRGGELVELQNLTPEGHLRFVLPRVHLTFRTRIDTRVEEHRARLATVMIEPDRRRVLLTWLTSVACRTEVDYLEETIVREKPLLR